MAPSEEADQPSAGGGSAEVPSGTVGGANATALGRKRSPIVQTKERAVEWWKKATSPELLATSTTVNLSKSLPYMEGRKSLRRFRGAYMKTRPLLAWFLFLLLLALWTYRGAVITNESVSASFQVLLGLDAGSRAAYIVLVVLLLLYMLVSIRLMTQYNLAYTWVITAIFIALTLIDIILGTYVPAFAVPSVYARSYLLGAFLFVQGLYIVTAWFLRHWIPFLQMQGWFLVKATLLEETAEEGSKRLKTPIPMDPSSRAIPSTGLVASSTYTYVQVLLPIFRLCFFKKDSITYSGEVDKEGRPHGYGRWTDTHWQGEILEGWWDRGIPVAPFKARETGSGSGFQAIRMGYVRCRADGVRELLLMPKNAPITAGVASAECSVSGLFFREYPVVRFMAEPRTPEDIAASHSEGKGKGLLASGKQLSNLATALKWVNRQLMTIRPSTDRGSVTISVEPEFGLQASGFYQEGEQETDMMESINVRALRTDEGEKSSGSSSQIPYSGIIGLDGWKSCHEDANREAVLYIHGYNSPTDWGVKLFALGNFPSYLKPFVFSWPTGQLYFFLAAKRSSTSEHTVQALIQTLEALDQAGFKRVHILTHSMGIRVLMAALPRMLDLMSSTKASSDKPHLPQKMENGLTIPTITILNPETGLVDFLHYGAKPLRMVSPVVTIYGDLKDTALFTASFWNSLDDNFINRDRPKKVNLEDDDKALCCGTFVWNRSLGKHLYEIKAPNGELYDIDIVDTTFLEANISDVRHNSFFLNRDIVEDVREIMTTGRRAHQRSRLEERGDNIYSFMVAPAHVVALS